MDDQLSSGISRRSALKRIGTGAAIVWTAPVLMSINSSASAASVVSGLGCTPGEFCGKGDPCRCYEIVEGGTICSPGRRCTCGSNCTTSADCPGNNKVCVINNQCSGQRFCVPVGSENGCLNPSLPVTEVPC
jgi:hypothetical protein